MTSLRTLFREDYKRNRGNIKLPLILLYRIAHWTSVCRKQRRWAFIWSSPVLAAYRLFTEYLLGYEIPAATEIGKGLILDHGHSIVINKNSIIGDFCRLRHCVTIGCKTEPDGSQGRSPRLGHHVDIGSNVCIIGPITIGDYVTIGAGAVVVTDIPSYSIAVGNPARVIRQRPRPQP
jgi:colanic acid biosynthesis acetyltransferase WcaB